MGIWGEDAAEFKPERWLTMEVVPDSYTNPVFHAGPRECLGKRLAMVEMKALLLTIVKEMRLTLAVPADAVRPDLQLTLGMSTGLPCHCQPGALMHELRSACGALITWVPMCSEAVELEFPMHG